MAESDTSSTVQADGKSGSWRSRALIYSVPLVILALGAYFWLTSGRFATTDNAYVQQSKVSVSADVTGRIVEVMADENMAVKAGDIMFRIDPEPYKIAVSQAKAAIASAEVQVQNLRVGYKNSGLDIAGAKEDISFALTEFDRQTKLLKRGFSTRARVEAAEHVLSDAREELRDAQGKAAEAKTKLSSGSSVSGQNPAIVAALAMLEKAELDLERTEVRAPIDGTISQADRLQLGQMMVSGLPVLSIVANNKSWVEANFKETDLDKIRIGQDAEIHIDAYPELKLTGKVIGIGAGTGSEFSVLPAQNANGNWVKVTQRVPVRIGIVGQSSRPLIAGLSADVSIDIREDESSSRGSGS